MCVHARTRLNALDSIDARGTQRERKKEGNSTSRPRENRGPEGPTLGTWGGGKPRECRARRRVPRYRSADAAYDYAAYSRNLRRCVRSHASLARDYLTRYLL